ncbi:hypothetical protein FD754_021995, partial [Muntiacus muntjak]
SLFKKEINVFPTVKQPLCWLFSVIVGHEATGVVGSIGEGVTTMKTDDKVIPHFLPQCRECNACHYPSGNLCIRTDITGHGVLADGTTRFACKGKLVYHFLSTSTFTEYTVVGEISIAKIDDAAPPEKVCLIGCGFSTGYGATIKIGKVTPGSICVVFGLGGVGLSVIMGCKSAGASRIIGVDLNKHKFQKAMADFTKPISEMLSERTGDPMGYSFEVIGHPETMVRASIRGATWYTSYLDCTKVGAPPSAKMLTYNPMLLFTRCMWKGCIFEACVLIYRQEKLRSCSKTDDFLEKKFDLDQLITHDLPLKKINEGFELLNSGQRLNVLTF